MLAGSSITASSRMRPWQKGQLRTSRRRCAPRAPPTGGIRPAPFGTLMRLLCDRNGGAFVGLSTLSP